MSDETSDIETGSTTTVAKVTFEIERQLAMPLASGLYLIATPIGHLADISLRAIAILARADVIYCEDTRHSRTLLAHYGIRGTLQPYHEHNAEEQRPRVLRDLENNRIVALISDAGTPLVSDPGFKLVRETTAQGYAVVSIPGPSATLTALTVSGLPTDAFFFAGFLPSKGGARKTRAAELATIPGTLVLFEAPTRLAATLTDLAAVLGDRQAAVARELTKLHEDIRRGTLSKLAQHFEATPPKGEVVIVVGPPEETEVSDTVIEAKLGPVLESLSIRDASRMVAEQLRISKARVYDVALAMKRGK